MKLKWIPIFFLLATFSACSQKSSNPGNGELQGCEISVEARMSLKNAPALKEYSPTTWQVTVESSCISQIQIKKGTTEIAKRPANSDGRTVVEFTVPGGYGAGNRMEIVDVMALDEKGEIVDGFSISADVFEVPVGYLWHNQACKWDVNHDGYVSPIDALLIINVLNASDAHNLSNDSFHTPHHTLPSAETGGYLDVDKNNEVTPNDANEIINYLNANGSGICP